MPALDRRVLESFMARLQTAGHDSIDAGCGPAQGRGQGTAMGPDALFALGIMYCAGREVALDLVTAHKWFNLAAMRGSVEARRYRSELALEMTKAEVARAQKLAREWLTRY
jgi:hypothetical protein